MCLSLAESHFFNVLPPQAIKPLFSFFLFFYFEKKKYFILKVNHMKHQERIWRIHIYASVMKECKTRALRHRPAQERELWHMPQKPRDPGFAIVSINLTSSPHILGKVPLALQTHSRPRKASCQRPGSTSEPNPRAPVECFNCRCIVTFFKRWSDVQPAAHISCGWSDNVCVDAALESVRIISNIPADLCHLLPSPTSLSILLLYVYLHFS